MLRRETVPGTMERIRNLRQGKKEHGVLLAVVYPDCPGPGLEPGPHSAWRCTNMAQNGGPCSESEPGEGADAGREGSTKMQEPAGVGTPACSLPGLHTPGCHLCHARSALSLPLFPSSPWAQEKAGARAVQERKSWPGLQASAWHRRGSRPALQSSPLR